MEQAYATAALPDTAAQVFSASLGVGLFVQRKTDFAFDDEPALQFSRVYRNQDDRSRAFGIGGSDSLICSWEVSGHRRRSSFFRTERGSISSINTEGRTAGDIYRIDWGEADRWVPKQYSWVTRGKS